MAKILTLYFIVSLSAFAILGASFYPIYKENFLIFALNFLYIFFFATLFGLFLKLRKPKFSLLLGLSTIFCAVFGSLYVILIYEHSGYLFQFVPSDAPFYDAGGRQVSQGNILEGISHLIDTTKYSFDDMGMIFYVSLIYKLVDSPILVKVFNLLVNGINIYLIYRLSKNIMSEKYAILASLTFAISSFNIWFLISGLKEPIMLLVILLFFDQYYVFKETRKLIAFITATVVLCCILFFRIPVIVFMIVSVMCGEFLNKGLNVKKVTAVIMIVGALFVAIFSFSEIINSYLSRGNNAQYKDIEKAKKINPALVFTSGIFGPFPTILPNAEKQSEDVSVYSPSLIFKLFYSSYFVLSIYFFLKEKKYSFIPIVAFCWIEILSLSLIDSTFKLRYAFPHIPFFIICAFYSIYLLHEKYANKYHFTKQSIFLFNISLVLLIFMWNILRN